MINWTCLRLTPVKIWNLKVKISLKHQILWKNLKTCSTSSQDLKQVPDKTTFVQLT